MIQRANCCQTKPVRCRGASLVVRAAAFNPTKHAVQQTNPSSSLHTTEAAVQTLGQAYINHPWCRELQIRLGKEQELFQGLARLHLDTFGSEPVLLLSEACDAAGILLNGQQEAQLVAALQSHEFSVIAGTLQILQCMPEGRLPQLVQQLQQLQEGSAKAATAAGQGSYLKLVCLGVRPASQCQGLGRALLGAALQQAQTQKQLLMADAAEPAAVQMLQRHGFKAVGSSGLCTQLAWTPV